MCKYLWDQIPLRITESQPWGPPGASKEYLDPPLPLPLFHCTVIPALGGLSNPLALYLSLSLPAFGVWWASLPGSPRSSAEGDGPATTAEWGRAPKWEESLAFGRGGAASSEAPLAHSSRSLLPSPASNSCNVFIPLPFSLSSFSSYFFKPSEYPSLQKRGKYSCFFL